MGRICNQRNLVEELTLHIARKCQKKNIKLRTKGAQGGDAKSASGPRWKWERSFNLPKWAGCEETA